MQPGLHSTKLLICIILEYHPLHDNNSLLDFNSLHLTPFPSPTFTPSQVETEPSSTSWGWGRCMVHILWKTSCIVSVPKTRHPLRGWFLSNWGPYYLTSWTRCSLLTNQTLEKKQPNNPSGCQQRSPSGGRRRKRIPSGGCWQRRNPSGGWLHRPSPSGGRWRRRDPAGGQPSNRATELEICDRRAEQEVSGARETGGCWSTVRGCSRTGTVDSCSSSTGDCRRTGATGVGVATDREPESSGLVSTGTADRGPESSGLASAG